MTQPQASPESKSDVHPSGALRQEAEPVVENLAQLRGWLESRGFRTETNGLRSQHNECDWYAWRRSSSLARECECNDGKPMQIVITPYAVSRPNWQSESVEVEVCGEYGNWWKLRAYSVSPQTLATCLDQIEAALIRAWNALAPKAPEAAS